MMGAREQRAISSFCLLEPENSQPYWLVVSAPTTIVQTHLDLTLKMLINIFSSGISIINIEQGPND
ncbi:hypothetical protein WG66_012948 [Moniliophthora roreri]|nr:hypothetical protein WG66_012948 [Moniliophthora roreri]